MIVTFVVFVFAGLWHGPSWLFVTFGVIHGVGLVFNQIMKRLNFFTLNKFISISPQPNVYDFTFLAPCPTSGQIIYGDKDELVSRESLTELKNRLKSQKGIDVLFSEIKGANHFF